MNTHTRTPNWIFFAILMLISGGATGQQSIAFSDNSTLKTVNEGDTVQLISGAQSNNEQIFYTTSGTAQIGVDYSIVQLNINNAPVYTNTGYVIRTNQQDFQAKLYIYTYDNTNANGSKTAIISLTNANGGAPTSITLNINTFTNPTSVINDINNDAIRVFPNPTTSLVQFSDVVNVQLFDITGKLIAEKQNVNTLDISSVSSGTYLLNTTDNKGLVIQRSKIVKE